MSRDICKPTFLPLSAISLQIYGFLFTFAVRIRHIVANIYKTWHFHRYILETGYF